MSLDWRADWLKIGESARKVRDRKFVLEERPQVDASRPTHGCFDNWIGCIEETMVSILGLEMPSRNCAVRVDHR